MGRGTFAIGVDLGGTNLRAAAVSAEGEAIEKILVATDSRARGPEDVLGVLADAVRALVARHANETNELAGIGIGVPGILEARTGVLRDSPSLPGWKDVPVRAILEASLQTRVVLDNDANGAAVGELWVGAARGASSVCMVTLGTGVGGALVAFGAPWRGENGMAGELGHMTLYPDGHPCNCGNRGCLEQYASATFVERRARSFDVLASSLVDVPRGGAARRIFELGMNGVAEAREVFRELGVSLGIAVAGLVNAFDPPVLVVGGGVSAAWELFSPALFSELAARSFVYRAGESEARTRVVRAALPSDAGLFGAAKMAFNAAESEASR